MFRLQVTVSTVLVVVHYPDVGNVNFTYIYIDYQYLMTDVNSIVHH